ncbi:hypothetical protein AB0M22_37665 [Nocardia sp. NPDC051756]|uniref:hypothetical protein n=1 Tax=Nocardia sp. NPDC051756 TaxID=3154751 RepID=UPI00343DA73A
MVVPDNQNSGVLQLSVDVGRGHEQKSREHLALTAIGARFTRNREFGGALEIFGHTINVDARYRYRSELRAIDQHG